MNAPLRLTETLPYVEAELNYHAPLAERAYSYTFDPPPGIERSNIRPEAHLVPVFDARPVLGEVSLDREGFALIGHETAVRDFFDDEEVRGVYYAEAERAIASATGADRVFTFDHTTRRRTEGATDRTPGTPRQPATRVHVDHTEKSGPQRVRDFFPEAAEALLRGRVQVINLWRPIRGPLRDAPLAMCDARTVAPEDLVKQDLIYRDRVGEIYGARFNPAHRWFTVPGMAREEALLLKCYDSATDGRARFMPHTAFTDPTTPADALPRESIEIRSLVFHYA